jgi:hypothetical protein
MSLKFSLHFLLIVSLFCTGLTISAQVLDFGTKIKIENGIKVTKKRLLIQVNSKEENWLSKIEIGHSPAEKFTLIEAKIIDSKGIEVRKLKKKDITTRNDRSYGTFYQDDLIESFDLYWNEYPYRIDYTYEIEVKEFISIAKWYPVHFTNVTTLNSSLQLETPLDYPILIDSDDRIFSDSTTLNDKKIHRWSYSRFDYLKSEIYAPPNQELIPHVSIVPQKFKYGVEGSSESWDAFGSWLSNLNEGTNSLTSSEMYVIDKLLEGIEDKKQIIKTLYQYLQAKTKYVNVSIDVGGLKSYPASYVCENKYGDCKALTTYMKAMLSYTGIESNYTIVNADTQIARINPYFPSQQFNHVILSVPLENDTIWLENTSNTHPFNYLGTFTQDRYVLMVNDKESVLRRTPKLDFNDVIEKRTFRFSMDENNTWKVSIDKTLGGEAFESYQPYKSQTNTKEQREKILREVALNEFVLSEWKIEPSESKKNKINVSVSGKCGSQFREVGSLKVINPLRIEIPAFKEPSKRTYPVRINYPINELDSIMYDLPHIETYKVQLPEAVELNSVFGSYQATYNIMDSSLIVTEHFQLNSRDIPIDEYPTFYSFLDSINKHKKTSAIILE